MTTPATPKPSLAERIKTLACKRPQYRCHADPNSTYVEGYKAAISNATELTAEADAELAQLRESEIRLRNALKVLLDIAEDEQIAGHSSKEMARNAIEFSFTTAPQPEAVAANPS